MRPVSLIFFLLLTSLSFSQPKIVSGPMRGYSTMTEVGVWVQMNQMSSLTLSYRSSNDKDQKTAPRPSNTILQNGSQVSKFIIPGLSPGITYTYEIQSEGQTVHEGSYEFETQTLWQYRTDPPAFKVAMGSCTYINEEAFDRPGDPYGSGYEIFERISDEQPDMTLWLGDNIYLRDADLQAESGYHHRYSHTRAVSQMQRLLQSTDNYAIWDDHDFGPNDANASWSHKDWALESFNLFWMNPPAHIDGVEGITTSFRYNDIDFFLLDNRFNRTSDDASHTEPQILGRTQIDWLVEAMKYSRAPYKIVAVGGQVINDAKVYENHANYAEEREYLLSSIVKSKIKGVVFVTGDRHHTELSRFEKDGIEIYDLTVSPLTSGVHAALDEPNSLRVDGTHVSDHNYAILEFTGERLAREMNISIFDQSGEEVWSKSIKR